MNGESPRLNELTGSGPVTWCGQLLKRERTYRLAASYHVPLFILHLSWNEPKALPMKLRAPDGTAYTCQYAHNQSRDSTIINKGIVRSSSREILEVILGQRFELVPTVRSTD